MRLKVFKPKKKRDRGAEALARLRQSWLRENDPDGWEPESEPVITPMLKAVGLCTVIDALRMHDDEDARTFLESYDACGKVDRKLLSLEAIAFASGVGSLRLAEIAQTALFLYTDMQHKMLLDVSKLKVTQSVIKAATDEVPITAYNSKTGMQEVVGKTNGDVKAMELFGRMAGTVPVPKGNTFAIQNNYGKPEEEAPVAHPWKTPEERLREIQDMTEPKRLPSPAAPPITIGRHIDRMQEQTVEILRGE